MSVFAVLGATGRTGGATARALLARGHEVRALTRDRLGDRALALATAGADLVRVAYDDRASLVAALDGADGLYAVHPSFDERGRHRAETERRHGETLAHAVAEAGVPRVVYGSAGTGAPASGVGHFDVKLDVEAALRASALTVTTLFPAPFLELLTDPAFAPAFGAWGVEPKVLGWDRPLPWVASRDVGAYAAAALDGTVDPGARAFLTGDRATLADARRAHEIASGRAPRRVPLPVWLYRRLAGDGLVDGWAYYRDDPSMAVFDADTLRDVVPEPVSVRAWLAEAFAEPVEA